MKFNELLTALSAVIRAPSSSVLGVDIQNSRMRVSALSFRGKAIQWIQTFTLDLSAPDVKPLYTIKKRLGDLWVEDAIVTTGLKGQDTLVRPLEIKLGRGKDVSSVFEFQAEPLLPYPIEEALVEKVTVREGEGVSHLTVVAARQDHVQAHLGRMHAHRIEPEVVSAEPVALASFACTFLPQESPQLVINIGEYATSCVLTLSGKLYLAREVTIGFKDFREAFAKDRKLSFEEATSALEEMMDIGTVSLEEYPKLGQVTAHFRQSVVRAVYSLNTPKANIEAVAKALTMTGEATALKGIPKLIAEALQIPLSTIEPPSHLARSDQELLTYAVSIGLALSCPSEELETVNFRKNSLAYPHPWKRLKKPIALYAGFCLLITLMVLFIGNLRVDRQEKFLQQDFGELIANEEYSLQRFEKEYQKGGAVEVELHDLSAAQILQRTLYLDKKLRATPELFPLHPNVPKVGDLLAWLATHPQVNPQEENSQAIQIERVSYTLAKRPDKNRPREKYQVQVELEFSAPTATMARAFHDSLIAPNPFVNPKSEVKWSSAKDKWRASFVLRDRTFYPSLGRKGS